MIGERMRLRDDVSTLSRTVKSGTMVLVSSEPFTTSVDSRGRVNIVDPNTGTMLVSGLHVDRLAPIGGQRHKQPTRKPKTSGTKDLFRKG